MRIHDTMAKGKVDFEPLNPPRVNMYVCGPTVYDEMHIGHARTFVSFDIVAKYLTFRGFEVRLVVNITDVDDKIIARAADRGIPALQLSSEYTDAFLRDVKSLKVTSVAEYVKASENIGEILDMVGRLVEDGFAYHLDGSVYFDVSRTHEYGKLSGQSMDQILSGARVEVNERKRNPGDFALWKAAKPGEVSWESPWGSGRPGWHIECSAMSMKYLGETLDIHGGGEDLIFPHHENEIQQSESCTGRPFSRFWMHVGMLNIGGAKMSKSLKNFIPIHEMLGRHPAETIRLFFANSLYRRQLDLSDDSLDETEQARIRLEGYVHGIASASGKGDGGELAGRLLSDFQSSMDDDFNTRDALAGIFQNLREAKRLSDEGMLSARGGSEIVEAFSKINAVLGIVRETAFQPGKPDGEIESLIEEREKARKARDFTSADSIREKLSAMGIILEDTGEGVRWRRK